MSDFISKIGHLDPRFYSLIYCDTGGPDVGGPDVGGPDVGGPDVGGPDVGGPDVRFPLRHRPVRRKAKVIPKMLKSLMLYIVQPAQAHTSIVSTLPIFNRKIVQTYYIYCQNVIIYHVPIYCQCPLFCAQDSSELLCDHDMPVRLHVLF